MKLAITSAFLCLCCTASQNPSKPERPVDVFQAWDGTWEGEFVGWNATGAEQYRIKVRHSYATVDANRQTVEIEDTMPDGTVIRGTGANTARIGKGGVLELRCRVEKSTGDVVVHEGTLVRGPGGARQIVWHSTATDRHECFREWVHTCGKERRYSIQGFGQYGETRMIMAGDYKRVE